MATRAVYSYKKDDNGGHLNGSRCGCFFRARGRKAACKSKAVQGITVKKSIIRDDTRILGFKNVECIHLEKKRKLGSHPEIAVTSVKVKKSQVSNELLQKDLPLNSKISSSPESGEFIRSDDDDDDSNKRRKINQESGICKSRDVISGCGSVDRYESLNEISRGAYGVVYRARDKKTGEIVAMKEEFHGLSIPSLREINILKSLNRHPSIVEFKEVVVDDHDGVYVVMEYLENDLKRYMDSREKHLTLGQVKCLMKQLLRGVKFLHDNRVMHRDLKPSNILINNGGKLKICDFGLSRHFGRLYSYSPNVVTLWYRAPELLLGAKSYSSAIDMWSVGCIMAELLLKEALFRGRSEIGQLDEIYRILGTPNETIWPGFRSLPGSSLRFVKRPYNLLRHKFSGAANVLTESGFDLLNRLLIYDPAKRITAESALNHVWLDELSS